MKMLPANIDIRDVERICGGKGAHKKMTNEQEKEILDRIDPVRRDIVKKFITGAAFAAPVIASFSMDGLTVSSALAQSINSSTS
jgi:hypothetical protein